MPILLNCRLSDIAFFASPESSGIGEATVILILYTEDFKNVTIF